MDKKSLYLLKVGGHGRIVPFFINLVEVWDLDNILLQIAVIFL